VCLLTVCLRSWALLPPLLLLLLVRLPYVLQFSVLRYESVIHEFDPYFNYRSTIKLVTEVRSTALSRVPYCCAVLAPHTACTASGLAALPDNNAVVRRVTAANGSTRIRRQPQQHDCSHTITCSSCSLEQWQTWLYLPGACVTPALHAGSIQKMYKGHPHCTQTSCWPHTHAHAAHAST
jgi:hypothetical protein